MITRLALKEAAKSLAQDAGPGSGATGVQLLLTDPTDYWTAIAQALALFGRDRPNLRVVDYTVPSQAFRFPLNGASSILPTDPSAPAKPTAALAGDGAGNVTNGSHRWVVTSVYTYGETEPSEPSDALTMVDKTMNGQVDVTIAAPSATTNLLRFRVYRQAADAPTADYQFAGSVAFVSGATVFTDNLADTGLGDSAPTDSNARTPDAWLDGASTISAIWWPYVEATQDDEAIDANGYRLRNGPSGVTLLEFIGFHAAAAQVIRFEFTRPHILDDDTPSLSTVKAGDVDALVALSAAMILQVAANKAVQNTGNTGLPGDVVDRRTQSDIFKSRSTDLMKLYNVLVGKGTSADIKAASGFLDVDITPSWRFGGQGDYIWHRRRTH